MAKDIMQAMRGRKEELPQLLPGQFGLCVDTDEVFIGNGDGNANIQMGAKGEKGDRGDKGDKGIVFTPSISEEGILSWTNDGELPNPPDLDLKEIPFKSITEDKIADGAIGTTQLAKGAVNNVRIGNNAVDARTIKDGEITEQKLSNSLAAVIDVLGCLAVDTRPKIPLCVLDDTGDMTPYYPGGQFLNFTHREGVQFGDLFIMWNSNGEDYDFLQANDENGYQLSKTIPAGYRAVCRLLKDYTTGADHRDGAIDVFIVKE